MVKSWKSLFANFAFSGRTWTGSFVKFLRNFHFGVSPLRISRKKRKKIKERLSFLAHNMCTVIDITGTGSFICKRFGTIQLEEERVTWTAATAATRPRSANGRLKDRWTARGRSVAYIPVVYAFNIRPRGAYARIASRRTTCRHGRIWWPMNGV